MVRITSNLIVLLRLIKFRPLVGPTAGKFENSGMFGSGVGFEDR